MNLWQYLKQGISFAEGLLQPSGKVVSAFAQGTSYQKTTCAGECVPRELYGHCTPIFNLTRAVVRSDLGSTRSDNPSQHIITRRFELTLLKAFADLRAIINQAPSGCQRPPVLKKHTEMENSYELICRFG